MADAASTNEAVKRILARHDDNLKLAAKSNVEEFDRTAGAPNPMEEVLKSKNIRQQDLR